MLPEKIPLTTYETMYRFIKMLETSKSRGEITSYTVSQQGTHYSPFDWRYSIYFDQHHAIEDATCYLYNKESDDVLEKFEDCDSIMFSKFGYCEEHDKIVETITNILDEVTPRTWNEQGFKHLGFIPKVLRVIYNSGEIESLNVMDWGKGYGDSIYYYPIEEDSDMHFLENVKECR